MFETAFGESIYKIAWFALILIRLTSRSSDSEPENNHQELERVEKAFQSRESSLTKAVILQAASLRSSRGSKSNDIFDLFVLPQNLNCGVYNVASAILESKS